ncbi:hypothetical protein BDN72DRAFT_958405 [Pluteus cervinus]|uniref:Uncharacterized protein n=1 Tax=Pluteus cervinus TaxID=181527 RepID=A0ACD3B0D6_9AGAR|nr:hypothetical protein BDN72DRAFT_958405 [Pluteus cervinus]
MSPVVNHALPNELWEHILLCLDYRSVLRCQQVSRLFNSIVATSAEIQYYGELEMDWMIDTRTSNLPMKERLALLRERRSAWDNLQWRILPRETIPSTYLAYDFVDGTYGIIQDNHEFMATVLPTKAREGHRKTHHLDFSVRDFCMDPTQDVIVFLGEPDTNDPATYLYVRSYESMAPHRESEQSRILVNCPQRPHNCMLQVVDNLIGVACNNRPGTELEIRIWNWKTGKQVYDGGSADTTGATAYSYTILNSQAFAVGTALTSGYVSIVDITSGIEVSRLLFPRLLSGEIRSIEVDSPPFLARPLKDCIFMASSTFRVHTFRLNYWSRDEGVLVLRAYILNEFLLSYATPSTSVQGPFPQEIPWEEWGPHNTRIMQADPWSDTHCFSEGVRVVLPLDFEEEDMCLQILDFNFPRNLSENDPEKSETSVVPCTSPGKISRPSRFHHDIETSLPYTKHLRPFPSSCPVDDETVLILGDSHVVAIINEGSSLEDDLFTMAI